MSRRTVLIVVIILVAIVSGAALTAGIVFFGLPTGTSQVVQPPGAGPQVPQATPAPKPGLTPPVTPSPTPQLVFATVAPSVTPQATPVDFDLVVAQVEPPQSRVLFNVTLQAKLNASLTNLGDSDAHGVLVQIRSRVGNSYLKVNNADPFVVTIGDLPARTTATQSLLLELKMSLAQGNQAQNEGMIFEITVLSNERTKRFPDMRCTQTGC